MQYRVLNFFFLVLTRAKNYCRKRQRGGNLRVQVTSLAVVLAACTPTAPPFTLTDVPHALPHIYQPPASTRLTKTINTNWTFQYFPAENADQAGAQNPDYPDEKWPVITVPHTWSTYETTGELHPFIKNPSETDDPYWWHGWGWYRKHFTISKELQGKKIFVELDGVQKYSQVYVNGQLLGDHKGGFTSFYFDLTPYLKFGEDNVLAVAVSNRRVDAFNIPPMNAGNWNLYGGIYRDVRLVIKDPLYIPFQGSPVHEGGTFVTTPQVSAEKATVQIKTWVKNERTTTQEVTLKTIVTDSLNRVIQVMEQKQQLTPGAEYAFDQTSRLILNPQLWSVETPYVYRVYSEVYAENKLTDTYQSPLGFRYFKWNYTEKRLYLNGKQQHLHGTNRHQEYPWLGDAVPKWLHALDLYDIRYNLNHNFLRTCHYTQDRFVYDWADRHGLVIAEEVPNIKSRDFSEEVQEQQVKEMIRRDRNHPSILFWSMGNETTDAADSRWAHQEDTTRIIHARHVSGNSAGDFAPHTHEQMDMENLLRCTIRGWYNADVKNLEPENGQHTGHEEFQHQMARKEGGSQRGRLDMGNGVMWLYADHGADREYVNSPLKHQNPKGWVDAYRIPKYLYYLWQANYAKKPMAFIHPHFWRKQYIGQQKDIVVDSNCAEVELLVNDKSIGKLTPSAQNFQTVTFQKVLIEAGIIRVVGYKNGKPVQNQVIMADAPARVVVQASHSKIPAQAGETILIKADIVDKKGVHVYGATNTLTWEVMGPASLVGAPVYTSDINKNEQTEGTMYIDAPVTNVIRTTDKAGLIMVKVKAAGLETGSLTIEAVAMPMLTVAGIEEPLLLKKNRQPVVQNLNATASLVKVPPLIRETTSDLHLKGTNTAGYATQISAILQKRNPAVTTQSPAFKTIVDVLAQHLVHDKGELVADDYNFNIALFNQAHYLIDAIDKTQLPVPFKSSLYAYYARQIIKEGANLNLNHEIKIWQKLPVAGSQLITLGRAENKSAFIGVKPVSDNQLEKAVAPFYSGWKTFSNTQVKHILQMLQVINPAGIQVNVSGDNSSGKYHLKPGEVVLLPPFSYFDNENK